MEYKSLYIRDADYEQLRKIFSYVLNKADSFKAYFPDGEEGFLNIGMTTTRNLPDINIKPLEGMDRGVEISGGLGEAIKQIFMDFEKPKPSGEGPGPCSIRLYKGNRELMYIGNFTDRIIHLMDHEISRIEEMGIDASKWHLIKINSEEDEEPESINLFKVQSNNDMNV